MMLAAVLAAVLGAQQQSVQKMFPYPYTQHDYPNGLRLIVVPTGYPNLVALQIVVQTGSRNEIEPGKSGFAHLFEHLMFRGTKTTPPEEYEKHLKQMGAASNASTWDDRTNYHTTFSKEDLDRIIRLEADRFQNLSFGEDVFRTETQAVLGEYNKNSAEPSEKLLEKLFDTAFDRHTYKHTTIGFLKDIEDMPNQYAYSKVFFERWYRPEFTTLILVGDVEAARAVQLVEKHWGRWKAGDYQPPPIPPEPAHDAPRKAHVAWPTETLPWVAVAYHAAAYTDTGIDSAALDLIGQLGFSQNSELYNKLVIEDQIVDALGVDTFEHVDPHLFTVTARLKDAADLAKVEDAMLGAVARFREDLVPVEKLDAVKRHVRYRFALSLNNSEAIADALMHFVALKRTPETINRAFEQYARITPEDLRAVARKYLVDRERIIVTLTGKK
jgi:zinc protease